MSYTIVATEIKPGMAITEETDGITRTFTVDRVESGESWVNAYTAERGMACIRPNSHVTVEGDRPMSASAVGTILRVPGVGSIVKVRDTGFIQWVDADRGDRIAPSAVERFDGVSVVYEPVDNDEVTEVPDVVERNEWERDNSEWRKHKWEDADGDVWEWRENDRLWHVISADGTSEYESGPSLNMAAFPVTRVK